MRLYAPHSKALPSCALLVTAVCGCSLFETPKGEWECMVDEICGPQATDESALQACEQALQDPEGSHADLVEVCTLRAEECADGTAPPEWCNEAPSTDDGGMGADSMVGDGDSSVASPADAGDGDAGAFGDGDSTGDGDTSSPCAPCPTQQVCDDTTGSCVECLGDRDCDSGVCDDNVCVECLSDVDCDSDSPACLRNICVGCTDSDEHCGGDAPLCETSTNTCAQCLSDGDCGDPSASLCDAGTCVPCTHNLHCAGVLTGDGATELGVCDTSGGDGVCVQCTGHDYAGCGTCDPVVHECGDDDEFTGDALVCDSLTKSCSDQPEASSGLCGECVSDAECPAGQLCVLQEFDSATIGYFCFWEKNAGQGGAPTSCPTARPYIETVLDADSIDGLTADVCALEVSTCPGHQDFRSPEVDCAPTGTPDDTLCGEPNVSDAYCRLFAPDPDVYRCTVPCLSDDDCRPGSDCDIMADPPHCEL